MRGDQRRGTEFAIAELRVLMDVAPPVDDLRLQGIGEPVEVGAEVLGVERWEGKQEEGERGKAAHDGLRGGVMSSVGGIGGRVNAGGRYTPQ